MDLINLFIHEAGHFFFKIFGRTLYFLGGSLLQIILPLALFIICFRKNALSSFLSALWTGESIINVSKYIKDAPDKRLKLISKNSIHDWNWLLKNNLELAKTISNIMLIIGFCFCIVSIGIFGYYITMEISRK